MAHSERVPRPPTPEGFDPSRARERARRPRGWRMEERQIAAIYEVIGRRRDIRRFRPEPVEEPLLERILAAAHRAPSVGLMQPWRFIVIRNERTRAAIRQLAARERLRQAERFGERTAHFLDQKVEGIMEAPVGICVCCDHGGPAQEVLGRATIPQTDIYSTACAIQNLWLAARAEGLGVGWVSFYRPADLRALLGLPEQVEPVAYLCVGWPDERPLRPGLETAGWAARAPLSAVVMHERWEGQRDQVSGNPGALRRGAEVEVRDRLDELLKPSGSLGALEVLLERWAALTGQPPKAKLRAGVLVCAADHGHTVHRTSLFSPGLSAQVAAAAARGETAVSVLAARGNHRLVVADLGLFGETPPGVLDRKVAAGSNDFLAGPALSEGQVERALAAGAKLCRGLAKEGVDCLVLGEIGIGNTTTAAALLCGLTGAAPEQAVGRGTGLDTAGLARKRAVVEQAIAVQGAPLSGWDVLRAYGGLELAALSGACLEALRVGLPVLLDGFATGVAALVARALEPAVGEVLFASHRSAEPGHRLVLAELGLEPLLELRLRLGEASGALLALPLIEGAANLLAEMGTFGEASAVERLPA